MPTILVVDGQRIGREHLVMLLTLQGNQVLEAGDGTEALEILANKKPDLVITDVLMRMMDGFEFLERMRVSRPTPPPVIFRVAAGYEKELRTSGTELEIPQIITKTSPPQEILTSIARALAGKSSNADAIPKANLIGLELLSSPVPIDPDATVYVVDDDVAICRLLATIMSSSGLKVETFSSGEQFLDSYLDEPGCLLTDVHMPGVSGIEMLATLRARRMQIPTIIMTGQGDLADAKMAMRYQVRDFLDKTVNRRTLLARVYAALEEDSNQRHMRSQAETYQKRLALLTARERELVKLLMDGRSSKEIAAKLKISTKTVAIHRTHLMSKTGAANVADLVRMSMIARDV